MNIENTREENYGPERGKWYKCISDVYLNGNPEEGILFKKGEIYKSKENGYISREDGIPDLYWWSDTFFPKFFERYRVGRKKKELRKLQI